MDTQAPPVDNPVAFLRYLHARRFCDREIAAILNDPPLYLLHRHRHAPPPLPAPDAPPRQHWTRRMVRRWRDKLGLAAKRHPRREGRHVGRSRVWHRRAYAAHWCNLGLDLNRAQVDILDALLDRPHTMKELLARYQWRRPPLLHRNSRSAIAALVYAAVVVMRDVPEDGRVVRQYALAPGVQPALGQRRRQATGVELLYNELGLM